MGKLSKIAGALDMGKKARMQRAQDLGFDVETPVYHGTPAKELNRFDDKFIGTTNDQGFYGRGHYFASTPGEASYYGPNVGEYFTKGKLLDLNNTTGDYTSSGHFKSYAPKLDEIGALNETQQKAFKAFNDADEYIDKNVKYVPFQNDDGTDGFMAVVELADGDYVREIATPTRMLGGGKAVMPATREEALEGLKHRFYSQASDSFSGLDDATASLSDYVRTDLGAEGLTDAAKNAGYQGIRYGDETVMFDPSNIRSTNAAFDPAKKDSSNLLAGTTAAVVGGGALVQTDDADASFIGKGGGKLFDDIAHAFAVKMKDSGVADEEIFKKTGMFQGADGQWRIEIDDSKRAYTPTRPVPADEVEAAREAMESAQQARAEWVNANKQKFRDPEINQDGRLALKAEYDALQQQFRENQQKYVSLENSGVAVKTVGEALDSDVMRAYPELDQIKFSHEDLPYQTRGAYGKNEGVIINRGMSPDNQESTVLHEMQHAIQEKEGFASGASFAAHVNELETQRDYVLRKVDDMNYRLRDLVRQSEEAVDAGDVQRAANLEESYKQTIQERGALSQKLIDSGINDPEVLREQAYQNYKSVAGEVEARNVQFRQDMSPAERRQSFPPSTEDTARADQIIPNNSRRADSVREFQQRRAMKKEKWRALRGRDRSSMANRLGTAQPAQNEFLANLANKFADYNRWTESKPGLDFILPRAPTELVDKWSYGQPTTWGDDISAALDLM